MPSADKVKGCQSFMIDCCFYCSTHIHSNFHSDSMLPQVNSRSWILLHAPLCLSVLPYFVMGFWSVFADLLSQVNSWWPIHQVVSYSNIYLFWLLSCQCVIDIIRGCSGILKPLCTPVLPCLKHVIFPPYPTVQGSWPLFTSFFLIVCNIPIMALIQIGIIPSRSWILFPFCASLSYHRN